MPVCASFFCVCALRWLCAQTAHQRQCWDKFSGKYFIAPLISIYYDDEDVCAERIKVKQQPHIENVMQSRRRQLIDCFFPTISAPHTLTECRASNNFFILFVAYQLSLWMIWTNLKMTFHISLFSFLQAQPYVRGKRFDAAINCVGFTTAPIWSGIFVSFIIGLVLAIGLNCILSIKPPNRFENSRGKQLTFTIQEWTACQPLDVDVEYQIIINKIITLIVSYSHFIQLRFN